MNFDLTTVGEYATIQGGYAYKSQDFQANGQWKVLKIKNIRNGYISYDDTSFVSNETASKTNEWMTRDGDVLVSMTGSGPSAPDSLVGRVARVWEGEEPALINQRVGRLVLKHINKIDPDFLFYLLSSKECQNFLVSNSTGSANQVNISSKIIESAICPQIDFKTSKTIADMLKTLDKKIKLLIETNVTLEAIAQALFKSWFVDFDPIHAKAEGRQPEGIDAETAALFPDSFEESELGLVPKGWRVGILNDICKITSGKRPCNRSDIPTYSVNIPLYGGAGVMGFTTETLYSDRKILTGRVGTLGQIHIAYPPFWASDNVLVLSPINNRDFFFCFHWLSTINMHALNRGSTQPLLTQKDLGNQKNAISPSNIMEEFSNIVTPIYEKISECNQQNQTLSSLRDTLLPRLISGQLRLPEASTLMESTPKQ